MFRRPLRSSWCNRRVKISGSDDEETKEEGEQHFPSESDHGENKARRLAPDAGSPLLGKDEMAPLAENINEGRIKGRKMKSGFGASRAVTALLSFGLDEEGEDGGESFKIKKAPVKTIIFQAQRKEDQNTVSKESEISQEMRSVNTEDMKKEGDDKPHSVDGKDSSSSASECPSEDSEDNVLDADFIKTARRKHLLARAEHNYISLNVSGGDLAQQKEISSEGSEDESDYERLAFAPKLRGLRQRKTECTASVNNALSEEIQEDKTQNKWEEQQIKRAIKLPQRVHTAGSLCGTQHMKTKFDPIVLLPPIHTEIIKKRLARRLTSLQDMHCSHQREYEKYIKDIEDSKSTIQELEKSSDAASNYKFYRTMNTYIGNLINCLNEKICRINELESEMHALLKQQAEILLKQRQEELRNESSFIQLLNRNGISDKECMEDDDNQKLLEDCEMQRGHRRHKGEMSSKLDHHEGMSSDDERPLRAMADFQKKKDSILQDRNNLFEDVHTDYCSIRNILLKFQHWKENFPDSYYDVHTSLCLPKLLNPLIRVQLIGWNPLEEDCVNLKEMLWFRDAEDFIRAKIISRFQRPDDPDENIVAKIIDKIIFPKITGLVDHVWDPLSTSQTKRLMQVCKNVFEEYSFPETDSRKAKQDLLSVVISRMKRSIEDVFIPLYPKSSVEDQTLPHATFQDRLFWSTVKLLSNILLWDGIIPENTLQELGLNKLLNRYLLSILINTPSGRDNVEKCNKVVECLPERWFRECEDGSTLPQLSNFSQHLLQLARRFYKDNYSSEIKDVILLLVKIKALHIANDFLEEHKMEHLKSFLSK